ncbi:hypothetical protein VKT23_012105 [Stygiomarasmius scandens]|uniref:Putative gamma-glutamylcyclotransferase n=1 Tax=Marasmiellus scandens TaxID=2682957 RepID=A0ABR1JBK5_9AGAR
MTSAFFYGTLMHPKILKLVIQNDGSHLSIAPAVLLEYTRHKVKHATYPGIIPYEQGRHLFDRELDREEKSVRGTIVTGLTESDMRKLNYFEGPQYICAEVDVHPLGPFLELSQNSGSEDASLIPSDPGPLPLELSPPMRAQVYVFINSSDLATELWSYEEFVRNHAWQWIN